MSQLDGRQQNQFYISPFLSRPIILSQILNYRLNGPRENERQYHSDHIADLAHTFRIEFWYEIAAREQLYEISLTGHLIKAIHLDYSTQEQLIQITEPLLPYLRRLNGKSFTGKVAQTVKGCLSSEIFKKVGSQWTLDESKADEFIRLANRKFATYLDKLRRNFPPFDLEKIPQPRKKFTKEKKLIHQITPKEEIQTTLNNIFELSQLDQYRFADQILKQQQLLMQQNMKQEDSLDANNFANDMSDMILRNLDHLKRQQFLEPRFMGILIGFNSIRSKLHDIYKF